MLFNHTLGNIRDKNGNNQPRHSSFTKLIQEHVPFARQCFNTTPCALILLIYEYYIKVTLFVFFSLYSHYIHLEYKSRLFVLSNNNVSFNHFTWYFPQCILPSSPILHPEDPTTPSTFRHSVKLYVRLSCFFSSRIQISTYLNKYTYCFAHIIEVIK